jgi:hypothetical protein
VSDTSFEEILQNFTDFIQQDGAKSRGQSYKTFLGKFDAFLRHGDEGECVRWHICYRLFEIKKDLLVRLFGGKKT